MSARADAAPLRVGVVGCTGRLGAFACALIESRSDFVLAARVARGDDLESSLRGGEVAVALDATRAGLGFDHAQRILRAGVRPLVGTSGVDLEQNAALDRLARELNLGGLVVPNFSLGVWMMQRACVEAARLFERCEIVELHHEKKRDAPSATALDTAARVRAARHDGGDVPIHSVRLPGLYAHQEVLFGSAGEVLTLRHDARGPEAFGPGLVRALHYVAHAEGVARGLDAALASEP